MNIKTAERLYKYRKLHKLSQEELANKIGVSRQAVSKWEMSEASPDTDNLIALSKIYGVSLDTLIMGENEPDEIKDETEIKEETENIADENDIIDEVIDEAVDGTIDGTNELIEETVSDFKTEEEESGRNKLKRFLYSFPYPVLATIVFFIYGFTGIGGGWVYGWLVFLTIPLYYTFIPAFFKRNPMIFCYPVLATYIFFWTGFRYGIWHPMWLIFLTIPLYYSICSMIKK